MKRWILILSIFLGHFTQANPCSSKIQISKKILTNSERLYSIAAQNVECMDSKNKFHQAIYTQFRNTISKKQIQIPTISSKLKDLFSLKKCL